MNEFELDVLIVGGGIAGLWLLDALHRKSYRTLLLEHRALGSGQTIASQGILHGGLKYSLGGLVDASSKAVAQMPARWRGSLCGNETPDLRAVRVLSPCCFMWRTDTLASRAGLLAAEVVVRTAVHKVAPQERPAALAQCPGNVLRVEEEVLDTSSLLEAFRAAHGERMLLIERGSFKVCPTANTGTEVRARVSGIEEPVTFRGQVVVLSAGEGNDELRKKMGLHQEAMQLRPLHMVMVRGKLPVLYGHCVDGNKTRATITTASDCDGQRTWIVGGEIAEQGANSSPQDLIDFARKELRSVLPGVDFGDTRWATYRINRAEGRNPGNRRPEGTVWRKEDSVITAWPTKLVLAPQLASEIAGSLRPTTRALRELTLPAHWPRPSVAFPPWEVCQEWIT